MVVAHLIIELDTSHLNAIVENRPQRVAISKVPGPLPPIGSESSTWREGLPLVAAHADRTAVLDEFEDAHLAIIVPGAVG